MTSENTSNADAAAPAEAPAASTGTGSATKPTRRRATRKAAAPPPPEPGATGAAEEPGVPSPVDAAPAADAPAEVPAEAAPARATRTRRATSTAAKAKADDAAAPTAAKRPRRATSKATSSAAAPAEEPAAADEASAGTGTAGTGTDIADASVSRPAPGIPPLDVLAELAPVARAAAAAAPEDEDAATPEDEDAATLQDEAGTPPQDADASAAVQSHQQPDQQPDPRTELPAVTDAGPRLATSAVLFQAPQPTTTRAGRRRVVAPAGPPQFIVPEIVTPAAGPRRGASTDAPRTTVTTGEGPSAPVTPPVTDTATSRDDSAGGPDAASTTGTAATEPRRRSRRASRPTAAPATLADAPADTAPVPGTPAVEDAAAAPMEASTEALTEAPVEAASDSTQAPPVRRGSRRRGGARATDAVQELLADAQPDAVVEDGLEVEPADDPTTDLSLPAAFDADDESAEDALTDEPGEDEDDDDTQDGAPRRRRRRGGRGRRSRSGEGDSPRPAAADEADADEDEDEDAAGADVEGEDEDEGASTDESTGSSRRRRRRRRSGRGTETVEADAAPVAARVRAPRAPSDEVTALRGSTRLEAKRQRRREGRDAGRRRQIITESEFLARRESVDRTMVVRELDGRTQIAVLEDGVLVEHYVSRQAQMSMAGNVYLGRVQNVLPSMEAAFVDVGKGRNAVLYAGEVNWDAAGLEGQPRRIEQALKSGDSVLVQVTKDPIGHKGARLTSQITLAGRYLVYVPGGGMTGISRKLPDNERARLKKLLREIVPDTAGVIVRTAAEGASEEELRADITRLQEQWAAIEKKAKTASAPALLQGEPDLAIRVVRDIFNDDFGSLVVQGDEAWQTISGYIGALAPDLADKVSRWTAEGDVFAAHRVDEQLAKGMDRKVWLPSGGSLVIDRTEAMTVVDVNTGKFTGSGGTLEETVTRNNLEAAEEIVRQLRLRDIGGIIVIDFIDMVLEINRDLVLRRLVECLGRDRTKHQVAEVTSLGLVQMTRKRVGQGLVEAFSETCEHCNGRGFIVHTDPTERAAGTPQPAQTQTPQPPIGSGSGSGGGGGGAVGDDAKRARRKRGGTKEQGPAATSIPTLPVLPEAREAVKATLATIAAAAAHAHEHNGHGHGQEHATTTTPVASAGTPAPVTTTTPPASALDGDLGAGSGSVPATGAGTSDAVAAVTEALEALRGAHPGAAQPDAAQPDAAQPALGEPDLADALAIAADPEVAPADLEPTTAEVLAVEEVAAEVVADAAGDPLEDLPAETLELVPVAPDVFDVPDDEPTDQRPVPDEPAEADQEQVSEPELGEPAAPDLGDVVAPDQPAEG